MKYILIILFTFILKQLPLNKMIFDFAKNTDPSVWLVVDDVVMGGRSDGQFEITKDGHGKFYGTVSLDNYGGFSSVRHRPDLVKINNVSTINIRIKGDGKNYQIRIKKSKFDRYSYIKTFSTTGDWEIISIPLTEMYPSFRGRMLDLPNFDGESIDEITFLIGNKKAESFQLKIDWIALK